MQTLAYPSKASPITSLGKAGTPRQESPQTYQMTVPSDAKEGTGRFVAIYAPSEDSQYPRNLRVLDGSGREVFSIPKQISLTCNFRVGDPPFRGREHYYSTPPGNYARIELVRGQTYTFEVTNGDKYPPDASKAMVVEVYATV